MPEATLKVTVDKFTFDIPPTLFYSEAGIWVKLEGNRVRLGLSDFTQQHSGDVSLPPACTHICFQLKRQRVWSHSSQQAPILARA